LLLDATARHGAAALRSIGARLEAGHRLRPGSARDVEFGRQGALSVDMIAQRLGFAGVSSFFHAFELDRQDPAHYAVSGAPSADRSPIHVDPRL
jgi:hypothetical protein